jgi:hypothetical protein
MKYIDDQFASILATYDATKPLPPEAIERRVSALKEERPTKASTLELELLTLCGASEDLLRQEVPELRRRWTALGGQTNSTKSVDESTKGALLAEAIFLTTQIFGEYEVQEEFANAKRQTVWYTLGVSLVAILLAVLVGWLNKNGILSEEAICGMCGGIVSVILRIYRMPPDKDALLSAKLLRSDRASIITKPLLGAAFALVLHLLFMSGLLSGGMFPSLSMHGKDEVVLFHRFLFGCVRATDTDFAKLLAWCFIGGFAERFVPDALDRLTNDGEKRNTAKEAARNR